MGDYATMELLQDAYHSMRDAWAAVSNDQRRDDTAPWNSWRNVPEDTPITSLDVLLQVVEFPAADAGKSVLHHLATLAEVYRPDAVTADGLTQYGWPGFSSYTLARAVLEGAAVVGWLLHPDTEERACRSARLHLWSACEHRKGDHAPAPHQPGSVEQIRKLVEEAGFEVREYGRQADLGVVVNGQVRGFYISQAVIDLLGNRGKSLYHGWSGSAHHAPWALAPWTSMQFAEDGSGIHLSTYHFEDKHVELAADVADILAAAGRARDTFFGRNASTAIDTCVNVATHLRDQIPAIRDRLGRPDGDPTIG